LLAKNRNKIGIRPRNLILRHLETKNEVSITASLYNLTSNLLAIGEINGAITIAFRFEHRDTMMISVMFQERAILKSLRNEMDRSMARRRNARNNGLINIG